AQHRRVRPFHPHPRPPLLPRPLRLAAGGFPGGLRRVPTHPQPPGGSPPGRRGRRGRDRGGAGRGAYVPAVSMRLAWVGFHMEGVPALEALVRAGAPVAAVFRLERALVAPHDASSTRRPALAARRTGAAAYRALSRRPGLPLHEVRNINDDDAVARLHELAPDVLFVIGWSQILHPPALRSARLGAIGAHA